MAGIFHISEEEAARDFGALIRRARSGEEIVVEESGRPVVIMKAAEGAVAGAQGKTAGEILAGLARWESEHGALAIDADFARDVAEARERMNQPLDSSKWD